MVEATLASTFTSSKKAKVVEEEAKKKALCQTRAIFQDAITVNIPIDATVDLGVAMKRTRKKRVQALYEQFPILKEENKQNNEKEAENAEDDYDEEEEEEIEQPERDEEEKFTNEPKPPTTSASTGLVPQRHEFGSIMDYLEAKYVRGVVIPSEKESSRRPVGAKSASGDAEATEDTTAKSTEETEDDIDDDEDEGQGSVYSESSFLDDRDLQRDVAEQVMAQTTTTKLELLGDDDFFVNVGDLDVEETELTEKNYDPLEDSYATKSKPSKKRKKPSTATSTSASDTKASSTPSSSSSPTKKKTSVIKKKKAKTTTGIANSASKKGKKKVKKAASVKTAKVEDEDRLKEKDGNDSDSSSEVAVAVAANSKKSTSKKSAEEMKALKAEADKHRAIMEKRFDTVKKMIKELNKEQLPRRPPLKSKVSITCPANKKEGDEVTFANPHIPGQRLRVQVPKGTFAGETFKVTVPVPKPTPSEGAEDQNKFPRALQDELDQYAREYDVFCKHEGEYRHAKDEEYPIHLEKRRKYEQVVKEFPKNLMTPIDSDYMKKLVRRARQNKSKRSKSAAVRRQSGDASATSPQPTTSAGAQPEKAASLAPAPAAPTPAQQQKTLLPSNNEQQDGTEHQMEEEEPLQTPERPTHRTINIPGRGAIFPGMRFRTLDFYQAAAPASGAAASAGTPGVLCGS